MRCFQFALLLGIISFESIHMVQDAKLKNIENKFYLK
jgi:hypothetical protein